MIIWLFCAFTQPLFLDMSLWSDSRPWLPRLYSWNNLGDCSLKYKPNPFNDKATSRSTRMATRKAPSWFSHRLLWNRYLVISLVYTFNHIDIDKCDVGMSCWNICISSCLWNSHILFRFIYGYLIVRWHGKIVQHCAVEIRFCCIVLLK